MQIRMQARSLGVSVIWGSLVVWCTDSQIRSKRIMILRCRMITISITTRTIRTGTTVWQDLKRAIQSSMEIQAVWRRRKGGQRVKRDTEKGNTTTSLTKGKSLMRKLSRSSRLVSANTLANLPLLWLGRMRIKVKMGDRKTASRLKKRRTMMMATSRTKTTKRLQRESQRSSQSRRRSRRSKRSSRKKSRRSSRETLSWR